MKIMKPYHEILTPVDGVQMLKPVSYTHLQTAGHLNTQNKNRCFDRNRNAAGHHKSES